MQHSSSSSSLTALPHTSQVGFLSLEELAILTPEQLKLHLDALWRALPDIEQVKSLPPSFIETILTATMGDLAERSLSHFNEIYNIGYCLLLSKYCKAYQQRVNQEFEREESALIKTLLNLISKLPTQMFISSLSFVYAGFLKKPNAVYSFTKSLSNNPTCIRQLCSQHLFSEKMNIFYKKLPSEQFFLINEIFLKGLALAISSPQSSKISPQIFELGLQPHSAPELRNALILGIKNHSLLPALSNDISGYFSVVHSLFKNGLDELGQLMITHALVDKEIFLSENVEKPEPEKFLSEILARYQLVQEKSPRRLNLFWQKYCLPGLIDYFSLNIDKISSLANTTQLARCHIQWLIFELSSSIGASNTPPELCEALYELGLYLGALDREGLVFLQNVFARKQALISNGSSSIESTSLAGQSVAYTPKIFFTIYQLINELQKYDACQKEHCWYSHPNHETFEKTQLNVVILCRDFKDFLAWFNHLPEQARPSWLIVFLIYYKNNLMAGRRQLSVAIAPITSCVQSLNNTQITKICGLNNTFTPMTFINLIIMGLSYAQFNSYKNSLGAKQQLALVSLITSRINIFLIEIQHLEDGWVINLLTNYFSSVDRLISTESLPTSCYGLFSKLPQAALDKIIQAKPSMLFNLVGYVPALKLRHHINWYSTKKLFDLLCFIMEKENELGQKITLLSELYSALPLEKILYLIAHTQRLRPDMLYSFIFVLKEINTAYLSHPLVTKRIFTTKKIILKAIKDPALNHFIMEIIAAPAHDHLLSIFFSKKELTSLALHSQEEHPQEIIALINRMIGVADTAQAESSIAPSGTISPSLLAVQANSSSSLSRHDLNSSEYIIDSEDLAEILEILSDNLPDIENITTTSRQPTAPLQQPALSMIAHHEALPEDFMEVYQILLEDNIFSEPIRTVHNMSQINLDEGTPVAENIIEIHNPAKEPILFDPKSASNKRHYENNGVDEDSDTTITKKIKKTNF